jgi:hypothetical protein
MNWRDYKITMRHAGLSWLGHLLPFGVVVALELGFNGHISTFGGKPCKSRRFGNSGLFLVHSKEIQDILEASREKHKAWDEQEKLETQKKQYEQLKEKFGEEDE